VVIRRLRLTYALRHGHGSGVCVMAGFATVPDAVRAAGTTVGQAVAALRSADCGTPVGELADALPGSVSAGAATDYAASWKQGFGAWCDDAGRHGQNLVAAAANYAGTEGVTAAGFRSDLESV
jgi:hypothetical protein